MNSVRFSLRYDLDEIEKKRTWVSFFVSTKYGTDIKKESFLDEIKENKFSSWKKERKKIL